MVSGRGLWATICRVLVTGCSHEAPFFLLGGFLSVNSEALHNAYRRGGGDMFVSVAASGRGELISARMVDEAARGASAVTTQLYGDDPEYSPAIEFARITVVQLAGVSSLRALDTWLAEFDDHLCRMGASPIIAPARAQWNPQWVEREFDVTLGLFAALRLDRVRDEDVWGGWHVEPQDTASALEHLAAWTYEGAEKSYLRVSNFQAPLAKREDPRRVASGVLARTLPAFPMGGLTGVSKARPSYRTASLSSAGMVVMAYAEPVSWSERAEQLITFLRVSAGLMDVAFLRPTSHRVREWSSSLRSGGQPLPPTTGASPYHRHRLRMREALLDVHGVQLLTLAHLERCRDLSSWHIEEVAGQRFLVSARDLEPWFGSTPPGTEILQQARRDFGAALSWPA